MRKTGWNVALLFLLWACALLPARGQTPAAAPTAAPPSAPSVPAPLPSSTAAPSPAPLPSPTSTQPPAWEWPRSSPEEQGVSSARLAALLEALRAEKRPLHCLLVVRHGVLVLEACAHPFDLRTRHNVYSTTKSVTSALVGIAMDEGLLGPVDTPVIDYFSSVTLDDPRKAQIRVEHLLAMSSGIEWNEPLYSGLSDLWGILEAGDPAQYFFSPALLHEPGAVFNYNSGGSHLLSMLVQSAAGQTAADFAAQRLFAPLDMRDTFWTQDATGHSVGGTGLQLLPGDMAKFGQMFLDGGEWQGRRVLSTAWVRASTQVHSTYAPGWGYGYQWWIRPQGDFHTLGWGGQQIRVFPAQDMVVVITAGAGGAGMLHHDLVDRYLLPAAASAGPLPPDPQAQARLETAVRAWAEPQAGPSAPLSPLAAGVDGKTWLVTGRGDWSMLSLHFPGGDEALLELSVDGDPMPLRVGLDGVYRVTDTQELGPVALYGWWETADTFVLAQQNLREADRRETRLQFGAEGLKLFSKWFIEPYEEESEAVPFGN